MLSVNGSVIFSLIWFFFCCSAWHNSSKEYMCNGELCIYLARGHISLVLMSFWNSVKEEEFTSVLLSCLITLHYIYEKLWRVSETTFYSLRELSDNQLTLCIKICIVIRIRTVCLERTLIVCTCWASICIPKQLWNTWTEFLSDEIQLQNVLLCVWSMLCMLDA